ncbi:hypothetical protein ACF0H5_012721 [Mactra antiquata]
MAIFGTASIWAKITLVLIAISLILQIVAIATIGWMSSQTTSESVQYSMGLWKARNCTSTGSCDTIDIPSTYQSSALKATIAFEMMFMVVIFLTLVVSASYVATERFRELPLAISIIVGCFISVFLSVIGMIIWLSQVPSQHYPGYSFGLTIVAMALMLLAGLLMIPDVRQYNSRRRPNIMKVRPHHETKGSKFQELRQDTPYNKRYSSRPQETVLKHYYNPNREPYIRSPPPTYRTQLNDPYPTKLNYGRDARTDIQTPDVYLGRVSTKIRRF